MYRRGNLFALCGKHFNLLSNTTGNSVPIDCRYGKDLLSASIPNAILMVIYLIDVMYYIA